MQQVEVQLVIQAPIERVWARYTDYVSWTQWAGVGAVRLARAGEPSPNGVGAVREISRFGIRVVDEEVLSFEPPQRMTYRIVRGGLPISDHLGEVRFEARGTDTLVTWRCQFRSRVPGLGGIFRRFITRLFRDALAGLSRDLA